MKRQIAALSPFVFGSLLLFATGCGRSQFPPNSSKTTVAAPAQKHYPTFRWVPHTITLVHGEKPRYSTLEYTSGYTVKETGNGCLPSIVHSHFKNQWTHGGLTYERYTFSAKRPARRYVCSLTYTLWYGSDEMTTTLWIKVQRKR
jgi:hypothetical protein